SGRLLRQFPGDNNDLASWIALSPDGKVVAISRGTEVDLWDHASGERVHILKGEKVEYRFAGLAFAPDGKTLAAGDQGGIHFWDLSTGKPSGRLPTQRQKSSITLLTYSPDGKILASASNFSGRLIQLWDVASRTLVHEWTRPSNVYSIAFSPDSKLLAAGVQDGIIPLWDVKTGQEVRTFYGASDVRAVGFSPDGKLLATGEYDNKQSHPVIGLWDAATGKELRRIEGRSHRIESLVFSADNRTVITSGTDQIIRLWDVATGTERAPRGNQGYVGSVTLSPDSRTLAYVNLDSIRLVDPATGEESGSLPTSSSALCLAFSPDGTMLAAGAHENAVLLWDVGTRKLRAKLKGDPKFDGFANGFFNSVVFTPDSKVLISGGNDAAVRFWDVTTGTELRRLSLKDEANRPCYVSTIALSPDGRLLAASGWAQQGNAGGITRLWETATGKELPHLTVGINERSGEPSRSLSWNWMGILHQRIVFSPDGKMFATNRLDKTIAVWEAASGKQRCSLQGHQQATLYLAFSPDSRVLASADLDNKIRLWDLETGKELRRLTGHRGKVNSLLFSVDGKMLISAAYDTTLLFWDLSGDRQALRLHPRPRSSQEPETLWSSLADSDASRAYQAIMALRTTPAQTVPFLQHHLQPVRTPDSRQTTRLIEDLDSLQFEVRQKATAELKGLGGLAEPALRGKLVQPLSPEARQRIEQLLEQVAVAGPEALRVLRAIEVLEHIGTPEARQLLKTLADGAPESLLTREAAASGRRLLKRPAD
ncbi:MAG TPA: WD40 repeat domain-containing protein, partial [Gemmataceae bacterium]|nr:WD40 repeat domain-containing protein [Gemmataceae bacterium]